MHHGLVVSPPNSQRGGSKRYTAGPRRIGGAPHSQLLSGSVIMSSSTQSSPRGFEPALPRLTKGLTVGQQPAHRRLPPAAPCRPSGRTVRAPTNPTKRQSIGSMSTLNLSGPSVKTGSRHTKLTAENFVPRASIKEAAKEPAGCTGAVPAGASVLPLLSFKSPNSTRSNGGVSERVSPAVTSSPTPTCSTLSPGPVVVLWNLTPYEEEEIKSYMPDVSFTGSIEASQKVQGSWASRDVKNGGYDDDNSHYRISVGDHIGYRYEIKKELGRGTFGVVVAAVDHRAPAEGRTVAIKLIKNRPAYTKQAKEEARLLKLLIDADPDDKANIVRLLDTFTFRNHFALVFEMLDGDLYSYMQANNYKPFAQESIYRFAEHTLTALAFLARHNIVHCDVKPENIVLEPPPQQQQQQRHSVNKGRPTRLDTVFQRDESTMPEPHAAAAVVPPPPPPLPAATAPRPSDPITGRLKLIDFGSSCTTDRRAFTYIQSRYYRAPEIVLGIPYTPKIDLWSFGCALCELANGLPIFPASCEGELLERITEYLGNVPRHLLAQGKRVEKFYAAVVRTDDPDDDDDDDDDEKEKEKEKDNGCGSSGDGSSEGEQQQQQQHQRRRHARRLQMLPGLSKKGRVRRAPGSRSIYAFLGSVRERYGREEAHLFADFVASFLVYDPEQRVSAEAALAHPWMVKWRTATAAAAAQ